MSTTTEVVVKSKSAPEGRRKLHLGRIAATQPGSRKHAWAVLDWLAAEVANGGDLDAVYALADRMNRGVL